MQNIQIHIMEELLSPSNPQQLVNTQSSLSSSIPDSNHLGILDIVIFFTVLLVSVSTGLLHTCLVNRRHNPKFSNSYELSHQNEKSRRLSQRGSDAGNDGYNEIQTSSLGFDSIGRETNLQTETNGLDRKEDACSEGKSEANTQHVGFALISDNRYGNHAGNTDIMFLLVCYSSIIITLGLPAYTCYHGASLAISFLPAMLAAHITAIVFINPLLKAYHNRHSSRYSVEERDGSKCKDYEKSLSLLNYLWKRFGGENGKEEQMITPIAEEDKSTSLKSGVMILIIITTLLVLILWIIFTSITLYGVASIVQRITSKSSVKSKLYTILTATFYTAIEGKPCVLWTDFVLSLLIFVGLATVLIVGIIDIPGGFSMLLEKARENSLNTRGDVSSDASNHYFVSMIGGQFLIWLCIYSAFYASEKRQKFKRSSQESKDVTSAPSNILYVLLFNFLFLSLFLMVVIAIGWILDITYTPIPCSYNQRAMPLTIYQAASTSAKGISNVVTKYSKLKVIWPPHVLSDFVIDRIGFRYGLHGFPGLFLAALCAHSLSMTSTGFNTISESLWNLSFGKARIYRQNRINDNVPSHPLQKQLFIRIVGPLSTFLSGCLIFAFTTNNDDKDSSRTNGAILNEAFQMIPTFISLASSIMGVVLAIFVIGIFFPFGNARGTIIGALLALLLAHCISIGCFISGPSQDPIPWMSLSNMGRSNRGDKICTNYSTGMKSANRQNINRIKDGNYPIDGSFGRPPSFGNPQQNDNGVYEGVLGNHGDKHDPNLASYPTNPNKKSGPQLPRSPISAGNSKLTFVKHFFGSDINKLTLLNVRRRRSAQNILVNETSIAFIAPNSRNSLLPSVTIANLYGNSYAPSIEYGAVSMPLSGSISKGFRKNYGEVQIQALRGKIKKKPPLVFRSPDSTDSNHTKNIVYDNDQSNQYIRPGSGTHHFGGGTASGGGGASNRRGKTIIEGGSNKLPPLDKQPIPYDEKENGVRGKQSEIGLIYRISYNLYGIVAFLMTVLFSLLFSAIFRFSSSKHKTYRQSVGPMTIAPSNAGSDDQIVQLNDDISADQLHTNNHKHGRIYDGMYYYDPALLHPIVHILCCLHAPELAYSQNEEAVETNLRVLERRKSIVQAAIMDEINMEEESGLTSYSLKQRHGSIYTVTSERGGHGEDETDMLKRQRRMSRHSRRSSDRSSTSGTIAAPVISNVSDDISNQKLMQSAAIASTNAIIQHKTAERRTSHELINDLQEQPELLRNRNLSRRNSLSPNVIAQSGFSLTPFATGIDQSSVHSRGGSFRHYDRRLSHQPDFTIGIPEISPHTGAVNIPRSPLTSIPVSSINTSGQHLQVPGSYNMGRSPLGSPRPHAPSNPISNVLSPIDDNSPTPEEWATHRRSSVVSAAIERQSSRRHARRSQSVMYKQGRPKRGKH